MRRIILTHLLMIMVGIFIAQGWETHHPPLTNTSLTVDLIETGQPRVVLANRGTRQQKEARQQNEGCELIPNGNMRQQKTQEQDGSTMKGLVF